MRVGEPLPRGRQVRRGMSAGARGPAPEGPRRPRGRPSCPPPPRSAMDAAPELLRVPPAELLDDVLREQFGPLPQQATICRLKRLPSSTQDVQLVLERRRVANAKERERVSSGRPRWVPAPGPGRLPPGSPQTRHPLQTPRGPGEPTSPLGARSCWDLRGPPGCPPPARGWRLTCDPPGAEQEAALGGRGAPRPLQKRLPLAGALNPRRRQGASLSRPPALRGAWDPFSLYPDGAWDRRPNGSYSFPYFRRRI